MHFFTSITANYLPKARVLADSVKRFNPEAVFHLVLSDKLPPDFSIAREPFDSLLTIPDLGIENLDSWIFKHSVVELCTAVKGSAFLAIFEKTDAQSVIYFDPDIVVLQDLSSLRLILDQANVVLTPHVVEPENHPAAIVDNEICSLQHGVYNLGFLAVNRSEGGLRFLRWWRDRLLAYCYDDIPRGLFTDQRWIDLAPAFFDDIKILRDKTYNVATWNLSHREVVRQGETLMIGGEPVKFFHFSGLDSGDQEVMLKKYAGNNVALGDLRKWYLDQLEKKGQNRIGHLPCAYSFYSNGDPIPYFHRVIYRSRAELMAAFPDPARVAESGDCFYRRMKRIVADVDTETVSAVGMDSERLVAAMLTSRSWRMTRFLRKMEGVAGKIYRATGMNSLIKG